MVSNPNKKPAKAAMYEYFNLLLILPTLNILVKV